jgi:hypothetical protein
MKHLFFSTALLVTLFSCKKEIITNTSNHLLSNIQQQLKDSISATDFTQLNFNESLITKYGEKGNVFLRIPFKDTNTGNYFILLKIEADEHFSSGKIIDISSTGGAGTQYNGHINIYSLQRNLQTASAIENGYIKSFHPVENSSLLNVVPVKTKTLPEIVIVRTMSPLVENFSSSNWYSLESFFYGTGGGGGGGLGGSSGGAYYSNSYPSVGGSRSSGGRSGSIPVADDPIYIDFEPVESLTAIDLKKYLQCFSNIPDAGATCTIKILTDIPVDTDPNSSFDWENGSPGHTFLQLTKQNGTQTVQQNIGFYPVTGWKSGLTPAPVKGKFVDNSYHEYNASFIMPLTPENFNSMLVHIQYLANFIKYDIDEYNCTDFALEVFNYKRGGNQLTIPMYDIPGGNAPFGTATPQGLYQKLKSLKKDQGAEGANIAIPGYKGFAGASKGSCN